jgi:SAM-dependent methyltransferase
VGTRSLSADRAAVRPAPPTSRRRGEEVLDMPGAHPELARRSLRDIAVANALFGGTRAVLTELSSVWAGLPRSATLLDVGTGAGDIPARARAAALRQGVTLETIGLEATAALAHGSRALSPLAVCGDARSLPFADRSIDVVICSQVLHHFFDGDAQLLLTELDRVARYRVIVSDLRRSRIAALGIWLASFGLAFHPVSRHDGVVSVMRGFRAHELRELVVATIGVEPMVRHRLGYRLTATWAPGS